MSFQIRCNLVFDFPCVLLLVLTVSSCKHPQDFVLPALKFPPIATTMFPQSHLQSHVVSHPDLPAILRTVNLPNLLLCKSINLLQPNLLILLVIFNLSDFIHQSDDIFVLAVMPVEALRRMIKRSVLLACFLSQRVFASDLRAIIFFQKLLYR